MKVLCILNASFPDVLNTGGRQAVFNMIDYLRNYVEFSIVYRKEYVISRKGADSLKKRWANVCFYEFRDVRTTADYMLLFFSKFIYRFIYRSASNQLSKNLKEEKVLSNRYFAFVNSIITERNVDIVQTEFHAGLNFCYALPENVLKVFVQHEIRYVRNLQLMNLKMDCVNDYNRYLYNKQKFAEIAAMNSYDLVITLTEEDKRRLIADGVTVPVYTSPASVNAGIVTSDFNAAKDRVVYLGSGLHMPNMQGLEWFLYEIWPCVIKKNNNVKLDVVGNWPEKIRQKFSKVPNVIFRGIIDDLSTILPGAIMVIPLKIGSGMRMKALEGIKNQCPIVSTSVGVEGLPFTDGKDCLITDTPEDFADAVVSFLADADKQEAYWKVSLQWYKELYSPEALGQRRLEAYKKLMTNAE